MTKFKFTYAKMSDSIDLSDKLESKSEIRPTVVEEAASMSKRSRFSDVVSCK